MTKETDGIPSSAFYAQESVKKLRTQNFEK